MEELLNQLLLGQWEDTGATFNGSRIYVVNYGDDKRLRFWNNDNSGSIDCDAVCSNIYEQLSDDGFNSMDASVLDGWNTVCYEIFDNDIF